MLVRTAVLAGVVTCLLFLPLSRPGAQTTGSAQGFQDVVIFSGLEQPTAVRFARDGRVFVAEKSGLIKVFDNLADSQASVFADLRTQVHNYWDRGLLGFALDPDFPTEPFVYVLYTRDADIGGAAPKWGRAGETSDDCPTPPGGTADGCTVSGRLSRLQASGSVMVGAEQVLADGWFQQYPGHSVGSIVFGPDGALYASGGDGASWQFIDYGQKGSPPNPGGDPPVPVGGTQTPPHAEGGALRAQDVRTTSDPTGFNGAVIRIDRRTGEPLPDNPLFSSPDVNARRIVGYGFRNPYRMAVRPGTNELWVGDVGWQNWEEINVILDPRAAPRNFGWPCYEDRGRQPGYDAADLRLCEELYAQPGAVTFAHYQYREGVSIVSGEACPNADAAVTGLTFYEGGSYPAQYDGALFFGDYTRGCIWAMLPGVGGRPDRTRISTLITDAANLVDLQIGPGGDLVYVDIAAGTIRRIVYNTGNDAPIAVVTANPTSGPIPLTVNFDGSASHDPDGTSPLTYSWDLDGNGIFGESTAMRAAWTYNTPATYTVRLRVTDSDGLTSTASVAIHAGNNAPSAAIDAPATTLRWRVGQPISFSGHGTDPEDGALPASAMKWALVMNHCSSATSCHEHPIREYVGVSSGSFIAPDHGYPSYLELSLTVTDSRGLSSTRSVRLDPQTVTVTLDSTPRGLRLALGSDTFTTPSPQTVLVGSVLSVSAPSPQTLSGTSYVFASWSDGGAQTHTITAPATAQTYTARFTASSSSSGPGEIVIHAAKAPVKAGTWRVVSDTSAASGARIEHPNAGMKATAQAAPADYFEATFDARAGTAYRLWIRGRAHNNSYANDSVYVQFDGSVNASGSAVYRIGTTQATPVIIEDCGGCGLAGWGWQDNGYGTGILGPTIYFARTGRQTVRVQGREDGISIDQIVLSAATYISRAPGTTKNDTTILPEAPSQNTPAAGDVVVHARRAALRAGTWRLVADTTAAGGQRLEHPDAGAPKPAGPLAAPSHYVELTFEAQAGRAYRLWTRGRAARDSYANDSVWIQFNSSVTATGTPVDRIGTTEATSIVLEECGGCGLAGWGWQDNGYGTAGPLIYFNRSGTQTMRIQAREDGISLDQIVFSPDTYLDTAPGAAKNDTTILAETGAAPPVAAGELVLYASQTALRAGAWRVTADSTAAGGARIEHPNAGAAKITTALAAPTHYFELTFDAEAGKPYHLWLRGRAAGDSWANDSVFVQFDGTVTEQGAAVHRIGTTSACEVNLEECSDCGLSGWGWQDNGYGVGVLGAHIYFARSGSQRLRVQTREDGISIDQIVLSPAKYLSVAPGAMTRDTTILPRTP